MVRNSQERSNPNSYWDWLPPEMQEYIVMFAEAQYLIDKKNE